MGNVRVLFLLVAYHNMDEVEDFIEHLRGIDEEGAFTFAVCDNSGGKESLPPDSLDCTFTARPDNPGYLEGALEARRAFVNKCSTPVDWVVITNSDLRFRSDSFVEVLDGNFDCNKPVVIGPRITEGTLPIEKNPHVVHPRTPRRLRLNRYLTATPRIAMGYLAVSAVRAALTVRFGLRTSVCRLADSTERQRIYSIYGALMIFSRAFFDEVGLPEDVPLLAEEFAVAEAALAAGATVWFEPSIHVHHDPNSTTGPKLTMSRARMLNKAFRYIDQAPKTR